MKKYQKEGDPKTWNVIKYHETPRNLDLRPAGCGNHRKSKWVRKMLKLHSDKITNPRIELVAYKLQHEISMGRMQLIGFAQKPLSIYKLQLIHSWLRSINILKLNSVIK